MQSGHYIAYVYSEDHWQLRRLVSHNACCIDDECIEMEAEKCWDQGGTFYGPGTDCDDDFVECCDEAGHDDTGSADAGGDVLAKTLDDALEQPVLQLLGPRPTRTRPEPPLEVDLLARVEQPVELEQVLVHLVEVVVAVLRDRRPVDVEDLGAARPPGLAPACPIPRRSSLLDLARRACDH